MTDITTTTATTAFEPMHLVEVESYSPYDNAYAAACSCGWTGDLQRERDAAVADGVEHRDQAGRGDGLDVVMTDLLDLQDGLADMVVWLAENWSADLPVPSVYGRGGHPLRRDPAGVELLVCCHDPAVLVRIGHLLGVPPVDDARTDDRGNRYRNVSQEFGRVTLRAFCQIEGPGS
jgi:hypothetical protein